MRFKILTIITLVTLVLDQATKLYVDANFRLHESVPVIQGWFHLTYVRNKGAAFGILADSAIRIPFFIGITVIALIAIFWYLRRVDEELRLTQFALSLVFAGALGNLIDRIRFGEVVDFLDVFWRTHHWPAFNVADSAISVGVCLLLIETWRDERRRKTARPASEHIE